MSERGGDPFLHVGRILGLVQTKVGVVQNQRFLGCNRRKEAAGW